MASVDHLAMIHLAATFAPLSDVEDVDQEAILLLLGELPTTPTAWEIDMLYLYTLLANVRRRDERGATAVEYGLLVGLIAVAIITTLLLLGPQLDALFQRVLAGLTQANAQP
jgi:pilus assembly protein Flp/PilA